MKDQKTSGKLMLLRTLPNLLAVSERVKRTARYMQGSHKPHLLCHATMFVVRDTGAAMKYMS